MTTSTVFGLPYLASQQATPEIPHNEALYMLEALLHGVKAIQNAPPGGPADGDTYIVGTAGSGAWLGKNNCIATYVGNAWRFVPGFNTLGAQIAMGPPQEGLTVYNQALDTIYRWTGAAWVTAASITPDNSLALSKLINATAQGNFINRRTAGAGSWEESTLAQTKTLLAYTAADVVNVPAGGISAVTTQGAVNELDTEKYTPAANTLPIADLVNATAQGSFINRRTAGAGTWEESTLAQTKTLLALTGADVANTPAGGIAAVTTQAAINELDTEKYTPAANTLPIADLVNASAQYNLMGRTSSGAGAWQEKATSADVFAMLGAANNAAILASIGAASYAAGTFTPTFTFVTPGNLSVSYANQTGVYKAIGDAIHIYIRMDFTPTYTTASGESRWAGLPFTCAAALVPVMAMTGNNAPVTPAGTANVVAGVLPASTSGFMQFIAALTGVSTTCTTAQYPSGAGTLFIATGFYFR